MKAIVGDGSVADGSRVEHVERVEGKGGSRVLAWLKLFRVVNLPTVPGDVLVGAASVLCRGADAAISSRYAQVIAAASLASVFLYMFGLIDNDIVGAKGDRGRPIPDGEISIGAARIARGLCLFAALIVGAAANLQPDWWIASFLLAMSVVVYNRTKLSLFMGLCRGLNVLSGAVVVGMCGIELAALALVAPLVWTLYITAVTWYSNGAGSHVNPGNPSCHPEWASETVKAVNTGSWKNNAAVEHPTSMASPSDLSYTAGQGRSNEEPLYLAMQILSMTPTGANSCKNPVNMDQYDRYCFDILDWAITESYGADVRYTSLGDFYQCDITVDICCDPAKLQKNDSNFKWWDYKHDNGDPQVKSYMDLRRDVYCDVFNVDVYRLLAANASPFSGNEEIVYEFFRSKGLGNAQIAAIMANIKAESNFFILLAIPGIQPLQLTPLFPTRLVWWPSGTTPLFSAPASGANGLRAPPFTECC